MYTGYMNTKPPAPNLSYPTSVNVNRNFYTKSDVESYYANFNAAVANVPSTIYYNGQNREVSSKPSPLNPDDLTRDYDGGGISDLDEVFRNPSAGKGFASVEQRPVLYLSEGRTAKFEVGSEIVREKKSVSENGVINTTGYEKFQDGLKLSLTLGRVSAESYAVDFELDVSTFDASKKTGDTIPPADKSVLTLPGLLVKDSHIYYVGSLKRKDSRRVFSLFGIDTGKSNDHLTVWFRVRELKK
jgi:hypothetical protein